MRRIASALVVLVVAVSPSQAQRAIETVLVDADGSVHRANTGSVDLDYKERFELRVLRPESADPSDPQPFPCMVRSVEFTISSGDKTVTRSFPMSEADPNAITTFRFTQSVKDVVAGSVSDVNVFNVERLSVTTRVVLRQPPVESERVTPCTEFRRLLPQEQHTDVFPIAARHYGAYILVDLKPIASGPAALLDILGGGLVNTLAYSSVGTAYVIGNGSPTDAMVSAPIAGYRGSSTGIFSWKQF